MPSAYFFWMTSCCSTIRCIISTQFQRHLSGASILPRSQPNKPSLALNVCGMNIPQKLCVYSSRTKIHPDLKPERTVKLRYRWDLALEMIKSCSSLVQSKHLKLPYKSYKIYFTNHFHKGWSVWYIGMIAMVIHSILWPSIRLFFLRSSGFVFDLRNTKGFD